MIGIIQDWLFSQLGINLDFNSLSENNPFKDGYILVDILKKYGLINNGFGYVTPTDNNLQCKTNLCSLKPLFDMLKVNFNDSIILDIVEGKSSTIMKLLYELYVCLENKQHLYFIKQICFEKVQSNLIECSNLQPFDENVKSHINYTLPENLCLEKPFSKNKDIISWYERKFKEVKNNLDDRLSLIKKEICQGTLLSGNENKNKCPCNDVNDQTLLNESLPNLYMYPAYYNHETLLNHNDFIIKYKNKLKQKIEKQNLENSLQNEILSMTWSKIIENQHKVYNDVFSDILLKQSHYEKQILNKLISTQMQIKVQDENQTRTNKLVLNEFEDQVNNDLKIKDDFLELEVLYRNEQKRVLELHKKLYKEKQNIKKNNAIAICNDIIRELTEIAIVASEYKLKYGQDVSRSMWNNWMQLFFKGKPVHIPLENLKEGVTYSVTEAAYDDIITVERNRDEILDENDVEEYLLSSGRWFFKDICLEEGTIRDNVISFIIYRLLSAKYPPPESPSPANIPLFKSATILLDFQNSISIDKLKMLLSKSKIHVFDIETAIMKSVSTFQKETFPPTEKKLKGNKNKSGSKNNKNNTKVLENIKNAKHINKVQKNETHKKQTSLKAQPIETLVENNHYLINKETQTSIVEVVKENVVIRTELGLIGEEVSKLLNEGITVDDSLVVKVIIAYLKTLEDAEGWLLLNYPNTLYQASELEHALTGKHLPIEDYIITEECELNTKENIDASIFKVKSKLYTSPEICKDDKKFVTHFSQIISTKYSDNQTSDKNNQDTSQNKENMKNYDEEQLGENNILQEDFLKLFYSKQASFQEFNYDITILNNIKKLARVILKEDMVNTSNSIELFGDDIISKLTNAKAKNKKNIVSPVRKKSKFGSNKKQSKAVIDTSAVKQKHFSDDDSEIVPTEIVTPKDTELKKEQTTEPSTINPGESGWEYITLPLDNQMAVLLANIWENIENCYLSFLRDIFFENRIINLRLVPYSTYTREEIEKIISKPDIKQDVVNCFTKTYNAIDNNLRTLPDVKSQLHCKVFEMQQALWKISDNDKQEIEAKRKQIILENWVADELCLLINNYLCLVQCESDRAFETMEFIQNYYLSMLYECPPTTVKVKISQPLIEKINANRFLKSIKISSILSNKQDITGSINFKEHQGQSSDNIIASSLINCCEEVDVFELLNESLLNEISKAKVYIKCTFDTLCSQITVEENTLSFKKRKEVKDKKLQKQNIQTQSIFNEKPKKNNKVKQYNELKVNGDEIDEKKKLLLLEWHFALSNEEKRFITCLELIRKKAEENIMEFYCYLENVFCQLCESALSKHAGDILNINKLCEYIHTAIEEESPLLYPPILAKSTFFINKTGTIKPKQEQYELKEVTEETRLCYFTVKQLNKLMHIFRIAGANGVIRKQAFCYILQDLMLFNSDDNQPHLPEIWHNLNESQLRDVMKNTFGTAYAIDWKDFIIYNLEIPYPSITDILLLKQSFLLFDLNESEIICKDDYEKVILWFEVDLPSNPAEVLKLVMIKNLLFEMFKVNESVTNYTALLLYFCKDYEPQNGLRKALCLSFGINVITSKDELYETIKKDIETKENVQTLLNNIITGVVMNRDGVLVYEISDSISQLSMINDNYINFYVSIPSDSIDSINNSVITHKSVVSIATEIEQVHEIPPREADDDSFEKSWTSRIPVATVVSVLNSLFHNQDKTYDLRNLYLGCLEEESDAEGMIEGHVLMTLSCIQKLFNATNKFKISSPCDILQQCLKDKGC